MSIGSVTDVVIGSAIVMIFHSNIFAYVTIVTEEDLGPHPAASEAIGTLLIASSTAIDSFVIRHYYLHVYMHGGRLGPSKATVTDS